MWTRRQSWIKREWAPVARVHKRRSVLGRSRSGHLARGRPGAREQPFAATDCSHVPRCCRRRRTVLIQRPQLPLEQRRPCHRPVHESRRSTRRGELVRTSRRDLRLGADRSRLRQRRTDGYRRARLVRSGERTQNRAMMINPAGGCNGSPSGSWALLDRSDAKLNLRGRRPSRPASRRCSCWAGARCPRPGSRPRAGSPPRPAPGCWPTRSSTSSDADESRSPTAERGLLASL
jgi:hypothetical protein